MNMPLFARAFLLVFIILSSFGQHAFCQDHIFGSWAAWFSGVRLKGHWGIHTDLQFRAGRDWSANNSILLRPGINYHLSDKHMVSMGYAATLATNQHLGHVRRLNEHRIWEQYNLFSKKTLHRFRLEQRFLRLQEDIVFTQRLRYFVRSVIPLQHHNNGFQEGYFIGVQNELFFNIQNASVLEKNFLDQNRAFASIGYRFKAKYDLELGYMNQFLNGNSLSESTMAHIIQLAFYSRLHWHD